MNTKNKLKLTIKKILPRKYSSLFFDIISKVKYLLNYYKYFGNKKKCPFCQKHFRKFISGGYKNLVLKEKKVIGGYFRENVFCPYCHSSDRERLVYLYLLNKTDLFSKKYKLLHIAPEQNLQKKILSHSNINYISADLDSPLAMIKMDVTNIGFADNTFDVIICNHVLEHIINDQKAIAEFYRVLKPNGWAILQVPISMSLKKTYEDYSVNLPKQKEKTFGQRDHVRIYAKDYINRLEDSGFDVSIYNFVKEFGESIVDKHGLIKNENLYICSKIIKK